VVRPIISVATEDTQVTAILLSVLKAVEFITGLFHTDRTVGLVTPVIVFFSLLAAVN